MMFVPGGEKSCCDRGVGVMFVMYQGGGGRNLAVVV